MDLKGLNLHIENLIPGTVIAAEIYRFIDISKITLTLGTGIERTLLFIAASYMLGVISATISRAIINSISEFAPRAMVFALLAHHKVSDLKKMLAKSDPYFKSMVAARKIYIFPWVHDWNCVYRSVLHMVLSSAGDKAKDEVYRRREQARLIRNFFVPIVLGAALFGGNDKSIFLVVVSSILCIILYAYSELNIFAEAADIYLNQPQLQGINRKSLPTKR